MGTNNDQQLMPPKWLSAQFITGVLSAYEKSPDLTITDLAFFPASAKGDHYASVMFRAKVKYTTDKGEISRSLIIKTMPEEQAQQKVLLTESHLFSTEIGMYTEVLPEFERILRKAGDNTKLHAECIYHSLEPRQVMIFEDQLEQGYSMIRDRESTPEELRGAYCKLAKFHAASMKVLQDNPNLLKEYKHGLFEMPSMMENPIMTAGMDPFIEMLGKVPELQKYKSYFEKRRKVRPWQT